MVGYVAYRGVIKVGKSIILETPKAKTNWLISGFRQGVNTILALLRCYRALIGCYLRVFRDNILFPSLSVNMGPTGRPEE